MMRSLFVCIIVLVSSTVSCLAADVQWRQKTLVTSYYRYLMSGELNGYCNELLAKATDEQKKEISASLSEKKKALFLRIKKDLTSEFGESAQAEFSSFMNTYTVAARDGNAEYRSEIARALAVSPVPGDYVALRNKVMNASMQKDIEDLSRFLSDIEMWITLKKRVKTAPALEIWLHREDVVEQAAAPAPVHFDGKTRSLRDAETPLPEFKADDTDEAANPMDSFSDLKKAKRQRAMDEAKAGMQQVAQERETAEREDAARKLEAANAEAEALKAQANKIAAVEKDAIEQSKNTWGSRIKNIIGATVSAAGGAFLGGIGERAGHEAVDAVFGSDHRR